MSSHIQSLENRVLMSVTAATLAADLAAVNSQITATRAATAQLKTADTTFRNSLVRDIKLLNTKSTRAANSKLIATLQRDVAIDSLKVTPTLNSLISTAKTYATLATADGKRLLLHPTKTSYQTKVNHDIVLLDSLSARLTKFADAAINAGDLIGPVYTQITTANPSLGSVVESNLQSEDALNTTGGEDAAGIVTAADQLAVDLTFPTSTGITLTGATLFRGDSTGTNLDNNGSQILHGGWTTGLDVQNVPGNYGAELFISTVPNPTPSEFLTPGTFAAALTTGANTFYFFADSDDTLGGGQTFGLNLFLGGAAASSPTLSGYTIPGSGQTLQADSSSSTSGLTFAVTPGAGTLTTPAGTFGKVTLSNFVVEGVSGQGSTVDLVNSTNTSAFSPPAHPDGIPDTYGTFTLTVG